MRLFTTILLFSLSSCGLSDGKHQEPVDAILAARPLDSTQLLTRIAVGSCFVQDGDDAIFETIAGLNPEVLMLLGDNVYGSTLFPDPGLNKLREGYALLSHSPAFRHLREQASLLVTWDDHDYGLNDGGADWKHREQSEQLFESVWAMDESVRSRPGVYSTTLVGPADRRVQFIMLDTRFFRSPLKPHDDRDKRFDRDHDSSKTMLGDAQWRWLEERLAEPADLRLIASSIQVHADGQFYEGWHTLPVERQRLYRILAETEANGVLLLSGDRHTAGLYRRDNLLSYPLYELTASSLNSPLQSHQRDPEPGPNRLGDRVFEANFGMLEIDWENSTVHLEIRDINATLLQQAVMQF